MAFGNPSQPSLNPSTVNPAAMLAEADRLRQAGKMVEAEALCRNLVAAQPNLPNGLNMLGLLLRARGELHEAETMMRRAIAAAPREAALHNNLGNILIAANDASGAEAAYRKAIQLKPDYADAFYNLGIALQSLGESENALVAHRKAIQLRSNYAQAIVQAAALLIDRGEPAEALATLDAAVAANANLYGAQYYRGVALAELDRYDDAIPVLQRAIELAPDRFEARYALAQAFAQVGRESDALLAYQRTFECKPDFLPALFDFTALAWSMGNDVRSMQSYVFARSKAGETPDLLLAEADMRMRFVDSHVEAERLLRQAQQIAPERADIANALGRALLLQGRYEESFPFLQKAITLESGSFRNRQDFGEALLKRGEANEARRVLEEARVLAPRDQTTLGYLALAYRELGDSAYDALVSDRFVREYEIAPPAGYADIAAFNRALAEELERLHTRYMAPIDQTLQNGTQTAGALFAQKSRAIEGVREQIRAAVADYIRNLPDDPTHPMLGRKDPEFAFSGSWSCRLHSAGFHTNHIHDQGWISSAYYVLLPDEVRDERHTQGDLKFGESKWRLSEADRPSRLVKPAVGKLVLFPSYFWHGTMPFQSSDMRLTVAFDVTPGPAQKKRALRSRY